MKFTLVTARGRIRSFRNRYGLLASTLQQSFQSSRVNVDPRRFTIKHPDDGIHPECRVLAQVAQPPR